MGGKTQQSYIEFKTVAWRALLAGSICVLAGCNALFDIEDPVLVAADEAVGDDEGADASLGAGECVLTSHCESSEVCIFRVCSPPCEADVDCDLGSRCLQTEDGLACIRSGDAQCSSDRDCPAGSDCLGAACRNGCDTDRDCLGNQRCADRACVGTDETRDPSDVGVDASTEPTPDGGGMACTPNHRRCTGNDFEVCGADGNWSDPTPCAFSCNGGQCTGACDPGDVSCGDDDREVCNADGEWERETCPVTCELGACVDRCTDGVADCTNGTPRACVAGAWAEGDPCPFSCSGGVCVGECFPNDQECVDGLLLTCGEDSQWDDGMPCPFVCSGDRCVGECEPDATRCLTLTEQETCDTSGQWSQNETCEFVCVDDACGGECIPASTRCADADNEEHCDAEGQWASRRPCVAGCVGDACAEGCASGQTRCSADGTALETCADAVFESDDCEFVCVDQACAGECVPGTTQCRDATSQQTCSAQGQWVAQVACEFACVEDACGGECVPATTQCADASTRQTCSNEGQWGDDFTCALGCSGTQCEGCPAPPAACMGAASGNVCATPTSYVTCSPDANGCVQATAPTACAEGTCSGDAGSASCSCPTPPGDCTGSGMVCRMNDVLARCGDDADGCLTTLEVQDCAPQVCTGSFPDAACECPSVPECSQGEGSSCASSTTLATCQSGQTGGCLQGSTATCVAGEFCVYSFPDSTCLAPYALGWPADLTGDGNHAAGVLGGVPISVTETVTLRHFGIISRSVGEVTMALYQGGSPPLSLVASVLGQPMVVGRNEYVVAAQPTLDPDTTYWIMAEFQAAATIGHDVQGEVTFRFATHSYGNPLPAPFTSSNFQTSTNMNYYILVLPR